jgi:hypothetical protein
VRFFKLLAIWIAFYLFVSAAGVAAIGQETSYQQPQWVIPVVPFAVQPVQPVQPVAPVMPPMQPLPRYQIHYPAPLRSFLFGRYITPVQPPPTAIRTPIND